MVGPSAPWASGRFKLIFKRETSSSDGPAQREIDGDTYLMGVLGDPISQIKTPQAINPIFKKMGANIICIPLHISAVDLQIAWAGLKSLQNLIGFGVTLPHKLEVFHLCDSLDEAAERVGAVNVVRREHDGTFRGYQFDGLGFARGLETQGHNIEGRDCLLLGAGGAASAIAHELIDRNASSLGIANRTHSKAEKLASSINDRIGRAVAYATNAPPNSGQLIINSTSLGMNSSDQFPVDPNCLDASMLVAEVIAKPEMTALLLEAERRGAQIHSGIHMVNNQVGEIAKHLSANLSKAI